MPFYCGTRAASICIVLGPNNHQRTPVDTPPDFSSLRPSIYQQFLCLATKDDSDRFLALLAGFTLHASRSMTLAAFFHHHSMNGTTRGSWINWGKQSVGRWVVRQEDAPVLTGESSWSCSASLSSGRAKKTISSRFLSEGPCETTPASGFQHRGDGRRKFHAFPAHRREGPSRPLARLSLLVGTTNRQSSWLIS